MADFRSEAEELAQMFRTMPRPVEPPPPLRYEPVVVGDLAQLKAMGRCPAGCCDGWHSEDVNGRSQAVRCARCEVPRVVSERFNAAGFPAWIHKLRAEWDDAVMSRAIPRGWATAAADRNRSIVLIGGTGRIKSWGIAAMGLDWVKARRGCRWVNWRAHLLAMREAGRVNEAMAPVVARMVATPLLLVDEVTDRATGASVEMAEMVIGARLELDRPVALTSNLTVTELQKTLGDRVWSRLAGGGEIVRLEGRDLRQRAE